MSISTVYIHQEMYDSAKSPVVVRDVDKQTCTLRLGTDATIFLSRAKAIEILDALSEWLRRTSERKPALTCNEHFEEDAATNSAMQRAHDDAPF